MDSPRVPIFVAVAQNAVLRVFNDFINDKLDFDI